MGGGGFVINKPIDGIYSYRWGGLNPINGDPQGVLADTLASYTLARLDGNTKPENLVFHGTTRPSLFGSIMNILSWKNVSMSFNIVYRFNYFFRRSSIDYTNLFNSYTGHKDYALRWQKP